LIRSVQFEKIGTAPTLPGFSLAASGVAGDQSLLFLFGSSEGCAETEGVLSHPKSGNLKRHRLLRVDAASERLIDLPELDLSFPRVDLFPDGRVLLTGARCVSRGQTDCDLNGITFDPRTGQTNHILLGHGISDLQIDDRGRIWIAYFDEGVFGNSVGQAGLVCFSALGEKVWDFPADADYAFDDCYALNVSGEEAAIFFYSDFPVCKIGAGFQLSWWRTELQGCHAFAMSGTEIFFSSQYRESPETAHLGRLAAGEIVDVRQVRLLMPDGSARPAGRLQGRGKHLYHFGADGVYRASLE
jgi:hypothetical protein